MRASTALSVVGAAALVAAAWVLHGDFGSNWDEMVHARYGALVLDWVRSGFRDTACNEWVNMRYYGPLFETIPAALVSDGGDLYAVRHLWIALLAIGVVAGTWTFVRRFAGGGAAAVAAAAALVAMPRFAGHAFHNSKDVPFALTVTWFMVAWACVVVGGDVRWRSYVRLGIAAGAVLCARPGGLPILLAFLFAGLVVADVTRDRTEPEVRVLPRLGAAFAIAWAMMVLPWPWAHESPVLNPIRAMGIAAAFDNVYPVLFDGAIVDSDAQPRTYVPWYLTHATVVIVARVGREASNDQTGTEQQGRCFQSIGLLEVFAWRPLYTFRTEVQHW